MLPPALVGKTHRGSFLCAQWELRVTERCLTDDLGQDPDADFERYRNLEIIRAFTDKRFERTENTRQVAPLTCGRTVWVLARGHDHRGGTWFDEDERVVWLLAYGRHRSGHEYDFFPYCKDLDARGLLLPTARDYERLVRDRDQRFAWSIAIEAPILLKKARESGVEERAMLGGEHGACIAVEAEPEIEATTIAFAAETMPFDYVPLILAAFHGDVAGWETAGEMPSRALHSDEIAFRHHHEPPDD